MRCLIIVIFLISLLIVIEAVTDVSLVNAQWEDFKATYNKQYNTELEESFRKKIFMDNLYKITDHNRLYARGEVTYKMGINEYSDMLHTEFVRTMNGLKRSNRTIRYLTDDAAAYIPPANVELPSFVDWRKKGAVTPIKNQGMCGSCWAFSATGSLEGQHFRKLKKLVSLSEQNLIDCSQKFGNDGCEGGWMDYAFQYVKANHGIDTEKAYPYKAENEPRCRYNPKNKGATDSGYVDITAGSEKDLQSAVATAGPVSVAIDASGDNFRHYSRGVFYDSECSTTVLDHAVLVVGYGTTKKGQDYWIVKNSWGTSWGDEGYILMSRNRDNNCGIATKASYPLV